MIVYRITHSRYRQDLSGEGAALFGARWNSKGTRLLYTSEHISLCALEMLVHVGLPFMGRHFHLLQLHIPDDEACAEIKLAKLKSQWQADISYTAFMGDQFAAGKQALILKVPSAVISDENNYLINPLHPAFRKLRIAHSAEFIFDKRLTSFT